MRTLWLVSGALVLGFGLGAGFIYRIKDVEREPVSAVHNLDYFVADESFSEVHNARAVLAGLSRRFLTELRSRAWMESQNKHQNSSQERVSSASGLIAALEQGIREFKGSEHELTLIPDLLRALKANRQFERWLEIYMAMVYTHPTEDLVLTFAREAVQMGARTGRQEDVLQALRHVCSIPIEFPSKTGLQSAVLKLFPRPSVVQDQKLPTSILHFHELNSLLPTAPEEQGTTLSTIEIRENQAKTEGVCSNVPGKRPANSENSPNNPLGECGTPYVPFCFDKELGDEGVLPHVSTCVAKVPKRCDNNIGPVLIQ